MNRLGGARVAEFSAMRSIAAGLGLVRRKPGVVAVWALIFFSLSVLQFAAGLAFPLPAPGAISGHPVVHVIFRAENLIPLLRVPFTAMLWLAALRAFLHPEDRPFAYLRFGRAEAQFTGYLLLVGVIAFVVLLLDTFAATSVIVSNRWVANLYVFELLETLPLLTTGVVGALLLVRFLLTPAFLLDQHPHPLRESWRLTRPIYWPLVGALIVVALANWIVALPILAVEWFKIAPPNLTGSGLKAWAAAVHQSVVQMHAHPLQAILSPTRLSESLMSAVTHAISNAVTSGIIGRAYRARPSAG